MSSKWTYKLSRVEFIVTVNAVNQYGAYLHTLYSKGFPSRSAAMDHLGEITIPHKHVVGRFVWKDALNDYHECYVIQRDVVLSEFEVDAH